MSKAAEPIYQLTLRPLPNPADPTGIRRLRDAQAVAAPRSTSVHRGQRDCRRRRAGNGGRDMSNERLDAINLLLSETANDEPDFDFRCSTRKIQSHRRTAI